MNGVLLYRRWTGSYSLKLVIDDLVYYISPGLSEKGLTWDESMHNKKDIVAEPERFILIPEWI